MKNAVHFGAGAIGRGFIGDLLHVSDYEITFIEVSEQLVDQINETKSYDLYLIENNYQKKTINNVQAISPIKHTKETIDAIINADIVTTSVWADNLSKIASVLAQGLKRRLHENKSKINVIACENALFATNTLKKELLNCGVNITEEQLDCIACFPNTAIDRMVFDKTVDDKKVVDIGRDYELVIEKDKLVHPETEPIIGAIYTDNLQKFLERKLYITNCSHAYAAYMGHLSGYKYVQEALEDDEIYKKVSVAVHESAAMLSEKYGFSQSDLKNYIQFVLNRFMTNGVYDPITRVGRSPIRKLDSSDRLVAPAIQCEKFGLNNNYLCEGIAAALLFENPKDGQAIEMNYYINKYGIEQAITHFTGVEKNSKTHANIMSYYQELSLNI